MHAHIEQPSALDFIEYFPNLDAIPRYGVEPLVLVGGGPLVTMRDPVAYDLVRRIYFGRPGFQVRFCNTRVPEPPELLTATEVVIIGREELFQCGRYREVAHALSLARWVKDVPPVAPGPVDTLRWKDLVWRRRQFDQVDFMRLFDVDFGQIIYHVVELRGRRVVVRSTRGIGGLATALMAKTMYEPRLRAELRQQAEALVTNQRGLRPDLGHELVVKFWLPDLDRIANLLDEVMRPLGDLPLDQLPFRFQLELVAIARAEGGPPSVSVASAPSVEIVEGSGTRGVRMGSWFKAITPKSLELLRLLNGKRDGERVRDLAGALYAGSARGVENLSQLVSATNEQLARGDSWEHRRAWIERTRQRYVLNLRPFGV